MRGIEVMLLAAFAGLVGLGLWNARQWLPQWNQKVVNSAPANADKTVAKVTGKRGVDKQSVGRHGVKGNISGIPDLAAGGITKVDVPSWLPAFPTRADLPVGASGVHILAKYGEPTARVTEMHAGQLLERYYYFNADRTRLTVATLAGGVLTNAESIPQ
jgi:hypothetical protein